MENEILTNNINSEKVVSPIIIGNNGVIAALFRKPETAGRVYTALLEEGYKQEDISLVMGENTRNKYFPDSNIRSTATDIGNKTLEGLGVGATVGGSVGAIAAAIGALGTSLVIPGLGIVVAGALAASFAGAGAGAAAGGVIGAIVGSKTPDDQAKLFEEGIKQGGVVLAIKAPSNEKRDTLYTQWQEMQKKESFSQAA